MHTSAACLRPVHRPALTCLAPADGGLEGPLQRSGDPQHPQTCMMQHELSQPWQHPGLPAHQITGSFWACFAGTAPGCGESKESDRRGICCCRSRQSCRCMSVEGAHQQLTRRSAHAFGRCSGTAGRQPVMTLQITCRRIPYENAVPLTHELQCAVVLPAERKTASPDALSGHCHPCGHHCCSTSDHSAQRFRKGWPPVTGGAP